MRRQWEADATEEREEGTAGRRRGRVMEILGERGGGTCPEEEGNEDAEGSDEEDEEEKGDCFFESLDRVQSSVSFAMDIPSSDDEDEEDDVRISFASAIAPPCDFRRISFATQEEVGCDTEDDRGGGQDFDYGIWMAEPMEMSLKERRRRLLQGMGLTSSKDLARSRSSIQSGRIPSFHLASSRLSSCVTAGDDDAPETDAAAKAASASPVSFPPPVIARCRSDTELVALVVRGSASPGPGPGPGPALMRASSAPPSISDQRGPPRTWGILGQEGEGRREAGTGGGRDVVDGPSLALASSVRIKNLDTGKEFVVSEISKDGTWGRLNDLQTGLQLTMDEFEKFLGYSPIVKELMRRANLGGGGDRKCSTNTSSQQAKSSKSSGRKKGGWFKNIKFVASSVTGLISEKDKGNAGLNAMGKSSGGSNSSDWLKVHQHGKSYKELTGLYMCQEIHAHQGAIWTMKFSSDWRYLASAGEDRVVHVWQVHECDTLSSSLRRQESRSSSHSHQPTANGSPDRLASLGLQPSKKTKKGKSSKKSIPDYIVMPETIFSLTEKPICSFEGHLDDVLDLSWSKSQHLLSSSMDKTVRLWDIESKTCLKLFAHNDYVTCIQFNPIDDGYFISGSLDAKVRIWSIPDRQVVDWSDLHEMVTAVCYTPDGQGALVGSHKGSCRIYKTSDCKLNQEAQVDIRNKKKKSHAKKITGFQFAPGNPSEVLVTAADSQIRVFDGLDMIHKFRGFRNTSSQISASYSTDGKYVVCASEDSHVYVWKRDPARSLGGAGGKNKGWSGTTRSHEHFYCKDVSVAIPWPGSSGGSNRGPASPTLPSWPRKYAHECGESSDSQISAASDDNFPSSSRSHYPPLPKKGSSEQALPSTDEFRNISHSGSDFGSGSFVSARSSSIRSSAGAKSSSISDSGTFSSSLSSWGWSSVGGGSNRISNIAAPNAWGLVVVTANLGGDIRIYQNFGLPLRLSRQTNLFY